MNETQTIENCTTTDNDSQKTSLGHLAVNICLRLILAVSGICGNSLTLVLLYKLKSKYNGHILMVYLALSDIFVCSMVDLDIPVKVTPFFNMTCSLYKVLCILKEGASVTVLGLFMATYTVVSLDR